MKIIFNSKYLRICCSLGFFATLVAVILFFRMTSDKIQNGMSKSEVLQAIKASHLPSIYFTRNGITYTAVRKNSILDIPGLFGPAVLIFDDNDILVDGTADILDDPYFSKKWGLFMDRKTIYDIHGKSKIEQAD